ncbi:MAG: hypothetical protein KDD44_02155, partial [Bdellovibrionales bacterium]|nr:hypothetical protein [Bdellovibrionales bacterium]
RPQSTREIIDYIRNERERMNTLSQRRSVVSESFISTLEAASQQALNGKTKRSRSALPDTTSLSRKLLSWTRPSSRPHLIHKLITPAQHHGGLQDRITAICRAFLWTLIAAAVGAALIGALAYLLGYQFAQRIEDGPAHYTVKLIASAAPETITEAVTSSLLPCLVLLLTLALPGTLLGAAAGSFKLVRHMFFLFFGFLSFASTILFANHIFNTGSLSSVTLRTVVAAGRATRAQIIDIATLQPLVASFETISLTDGVLLRRAGSLSAMSDLVVAVVFGIYVLLLIYACRRSLYYLAQKPDLGYLLVGIGLPLLLVAETITLSQGTAVATATIPYLNIGSYGLRFDTPMHISSAMNWAFLLMSVIVLVPLVGGVRKDY